MRRKSPLSFLKASREVGCYSMLFMCYRCNKIPQAGWLKHESLIFSQFWSLEVQEQGASKADFLFGLSSWLVGVCLLAVSSHGLSSELFWVYISSSCKDTGQIRSWPILITSFNFIISLKVLSRKRDTDV